MSFLFSTPSNHYFKKESDFKTCHSIQAHLASGECETGNYLASKCLVGKLLVNVWQLLKTRSGPLKEVMRSAFSDSEMAEQDIHSGTAGFPGGGREGQGAAAQGTVLLTFPVWLSKSRPRLWNMFWKLLPEDTHPFGDSLFLDSQCRCLDSDDIQGCVSRPIIWLVTEEQGLSRWLLVGARDRRSKITCLFPPGSC